MKKKAIFIFCILLINSNLTAQNIFNLNYSRIIFENFTSQSVSIQAEFNPIFIIKEYTFKDRLDTLNIKSKFPYRIITSELDSNKQFIYTTYLVNPFETIHIKKTNSKTVAFSNESQQRSNEINFFISMEKKLGNFEGSITYIQHKRKDPESLFNNIRSIHKQRLEFLKSYEKELIISNELKIKLKSIFLYKEYSELLSHCEMTGILDKNFLYSFKEIQKFLSQFQEVIPDTNNIYYLDAAKWYFKLNYLKNRDFSDFYDSIQKKTTGNLKDFLTIEIIPRFVKKMNFFEIMNDFLNSTENEDLKKAALEKFEDFMLTNKVIDTLDSDKNSIGLYNLKSKKIVTWDEIISSEGTKYIDFWASWCGGCRSSIPKLMDLERNLNNPEFKIIYVSLDENSSVWEKVSKKENLPEENSYLLLNTESNLLLEKFKIHSIPRYMLVDGKGKIQDENALDIYNYTQLYERVLSILNR